MVCEASNHRRRKLPCVRVDVFVLWAVTISQNTTWDYSSTYHCNWLIALICVPNQLKPTDHVFRAKKFYTAWSSQAEIWKFNFQTKIKTMIVQKNVRNRVGRKQLWRKQGRANRAPSGKYQNKFISSTCRLIFSLNKRNRKWAVAWLYSTLILRPSRCLGSARSIDQLKQVQITPKHVEVVESS